MIELLSQPWPWYLAGPLIGIFAALLLTLGGRSFGVSANLRHLCAATAPGECSFLRYDWRKGWWNLLFAAGIVIGGFSAGLFLSHPEAVAISEATRTDLAALGLAADAGFVPAEIYGVDALTSPRALLILIAGGFLIGFGARYAGGCTSGHAVMGLANLQLPSLVAVLGFFAGGLISTHFVLPLTFGG